MKQPELGKKISELRKAKGLTQEELVEKCNIGVRTIQRIEAGEVTPRSYTIKTILAALEYDINLISEDADKWEMVITWIKRLFLIEVDLNTPYEYIVKQLNIAWIVGLVYFVLGFFESVGDYYLYNKDLMIYSKAFYVFIKIASLITFIYFQRGFILIGSLFKNYLLKIISFILIICNVLLIGYDIASVFYNSIEKEFVMGGFALTFGSLGIVYGFALYRFKDLTGSLAKYAGIFEIIAGCFFLTLILSFMGFILLIPAEIFEIIMLFKVVELIQAKHESSIA
jgi:transcriptional regulator with XRE-family HTH domain